jgi:hypothetical protein
VRLSPLAGAGDRAGVRLVCPLPVKAPSLQGAESHNQCMSQNVTGSSSDFEVVVFSVPQGTICFASGRN